MYQKFARILERGSAYCVTGQDRRLVRTFNFIGYAFLGVICPVLIVLNTIARDYAELAIIFVVIVIFLWTLRLNQRGKSQQATIIATLTGISAIYPLVYLNSFQIAAPYSSLLASFVVIIYVRNAFWRNAIFVFGFITYVATQTFQLKFRAFNLPEHLISILFVLLIFIIFKYVGTLQNKYAKQLEDQNQIIKDQTRQLLEVQREKHLQELKLKQNDLELVVANSSAQIQIKENLMESLKVVKGSKMPVVEIKRIILELKQQIESQKRIGKLQGSLDEVNTQFLEKLYIHAPNISKTERELCMYIKLGLVTKEIAALKNTTSNTINVTKTRLRNKLGLKTNTEISAFLRKL